MTAPPRALAAWVAAVAIGLVTAPAQAQINPGPPGPFVIDLRGATSGVPSTGEFYPPVAADSDDQQDDAPELTVPARGFGFDVGAHVYPFRLGPARIGIGLTFGRVRATAVSAAPEEDDGSAGGGGSNSGQDATDADEDLPTPVDVVVTGQTLAPQLSFNFGTSRGWSYLSVGYGRAAVRARVGDAERETDGLSAINYGGGARWFFTDHLGVGFDLRWHKVGSGDTTPATTMFAAVVGLSIK